MSEMFDLNLIGGVYNKFGNEIERIYNNRNEIILELDYGSNDYFWVEPDESMIGTGSNYIGFFKRVPYKDVILEQNSIQYSFDGIHWEYMPYGLNEEDNRLLIDKKTYFRYVHDGYIRHRMYGIHIDENSKSSTLKCNVGGSLHKYMNNVYYSDNIFNGNYNDIAFFYGVYIINANKLKIDYFENNNITSHGCDRMFKGQTFMKSAPALPYTTLASFCYFGMFSGCTSLVTAPSLPSTTLASNCYANMFDGCDSLVNAPALPATTLDSNCYANMFKNCTSLVTAPELPATTLAVSCYANMFSGCTSLVNAPSLPATTLANGCYNSMFRGCTSLANAPELNATTLAESCYASMFEACSSLVTAPILPATKLEYGCYASMFKNCTSLLNVHNLPATTLEVQCYVYMFSGCTSLVTAPVLPATILVDACYDYMFEHCSSLSYITCYAENITTNSSIDYWVNGVNNTGVFNKRKGVEWPIGVNGIPENWTVNEI